MSEDPKIRVLVVDDEESIRKMLRLCLEGAGYSVMLAGSGDAALKLARKTPPDIAMMDVRLGATSGVDVTRSLLQETPGTQVVMMTAYATIDNAVDAMRAGAVEYLPKPFTPAQVLHVMGSVVKTMRLTTELAEAREGSQKTRARFETASPAMRAALDVGARVAPTDATILIQGETGTGKGVLARHLHSLSTRARHPFVTFNCAGVSPSLIESELFGHAKGAFTGADSPHVGHVEAAGSGTLFLDEIGDLPREVQGKLLRLLEEREYVRVGDTEPRRSGARVIAATHRDLKSEASKGTFREDLFYRLNVVMLRVPPLRERAEDITGLTESILRDLAKQHRKPLLTPSAEATSALRAYAWPGNLRELVNVLERAEILAAGALLTPDLLPEETRGASTSPPQSDPNDESLEAAERSHVLAVLARHPTLEAAARALRIDPSTLYRKRERYGVR